MADPLRSSGCEPTAGNCTSVCGVAENKTVVAEEHEGEHKESTKEKGRLPSRATYIHKKSVQSSTRLERADIPHPRSSALEHANDCVT